MGEFQYGSAFLSAITVTIPNGSSLSAAVVLNGRGLSKIYMSAGWTAANLTFQVSHDGTNFGNLRDSYGNEVTATVSAAGDVIVLDPTIFYGINYLKVRSGTSGTPVSQGADRTLTLEARPI